MRLRVSITDTNGNGGCTTACPGIPDQPIQPVVVVSSDDQSFLERWWWAILLCILAIIIIIVLLIWAFWYRGPTTAVVRTATITHIPVVAQPAVLAQPTTFQSPVLAQPTVITQQTIPNVAFGTAGPGLVPAPQGFGLAPITSASAPPVVFRSSPLPLN